MQRQRQTEAHSADGGTTALPPIGKRLPSSPAKFDIDAEPNVSRSTIARRGADAIAIRLATSQSCILGLLGKSLAEQVAGLLLDEADGSTVMLPQRTIAAMLGVQRQSVNKVPRQLEDDGLINIGYGTIGLSNRDALTRISN